MDNVIQPKLFRFECSFYFFREGTKSSTTLIGQGETKRYNHDDLLPTPQWHVNRDIILAPHGICQSISIPWQIKLTYGSHVLCVASKVCVIIEH